MLFEDLNDASLVGLLCELVRRCAFIVDVVEVGAVLQQVLDDVGLVALDRVVYRCLFVVVDQVSITAETHKLLHGF